MISVEFECALFQKQVPKKKEFRQICLLTFKDFLPIPVCPLLH